MKGNRYELEEIARVCHEANRAMQYIQGDPCPSQPWDNESTILRNALINAVRLMRMNYSNEEIHQEWCDRYREEGWTCGPVKDSDQHTHPCLVPYCELPREQRHKTEVIRGIVFAMSTL